MVSVKLLSLPDKYIEASKKLVTILDEYKFDVKYAYWYLSYDDNQSWVDGEWRFLIASEYVQKYGCLKGYACIQKIMEINKANVIELHDLELVGYSGGDANKHFVLERFDIK